MCKTLKESVNLYTRAYNKRRRRPLRFTTRPQAATTAAADALQRSIKSRRTSQVGGTTTRTNNQPANQPTTVNQASEFNKNL